MYILAYTKHSVIFQFSLLEDLLEKFISKLFDGSVTYLPERYKIFLFLSRVSFAVDIKIKGITYDI